MCAPCPSLATSASAPIPSVRRARASHSEAPLVAGTSPLLDDAQFDMPFEMSRGRIERKLAAQAQAIQRRVTRLRKQQDAQ